ncbi:MAG TPA: hypothetical protein DET40_00805 [Lentisphaeria bacterium]|nr:MAG: hypothetical protein A2X45_06365 [Lentisphaerae bacterium GWF2_50_93]HCE42072.1 hypothetical protein [Lentisphaeria bacterium]
MPCTITLEFPDTLPDALHETREQFEHEAKVAMAVKLFELKRLSSGQAASLLGIERVNFLMMLKNYNVSIIDITESELKSDLTHA